MHELGHAQLSWVPNPTFNLTTCSNYDTVTISNIGALNTIGQLGMPLVALYFDMIRLGYKRLIV